MYLASSRSAAHVLLPTSSSSHTILHSLSSHIRCRHHAPKSLSTFTPKTPGSIETKDLSPIRYCGTCTLACFSMQGSKSFGVFRAGRLWMHGPGVDLGAAVSWARCRVVRKPSTDRTCGVFIGVPNRDLSCN
ncbi:hypothetical protein EJ06DRAFT_80814 [Trichodelitschia bisporula]|uniref:Uncharacterized protein n=1 Tax=Trichodelitschia bisporula TaxID=703511 RepID=A0A6G1HTS6_9PEZI|nr:hypothetical protein EJ06DRAFT_80814 [Trichodelitschia bisporula]